ncbi:MAG: TolC family outer membrane protein [Gammaproteobacteria bacterium]|nr:TolC family outer membrane protein [Gammaproteobacteria bacterium]
MKLLKTVLFAAGFTAFSTPVLAEDLLDVYRMARTSDPQIQAAEYNYLAAKESKPQAWANYLPQVNASASQGTTESESERDELDFDSQNQTVNVFRIDSASETDSLDWSVSLRQTLFNWGSIQQIQQAGAEVAKAEADFQAAQQELIVRVAEQYFNLLGAQDSLEAAQINKESIGRQLEQSKKRFEVGLIAVTDVQESQAAYDQAVAEEIAAQRQVTTAREQMRAIVGEYVGNLEAPVESMPLRVPQPAAAEQWVQMALEQNLNVISNRFALDSAEETVDIRRAGHYPTLDLVARHSYSESDTLVTDTPIPFPSTNREGTTDYIGVELSVPIFSGFRTSSQVRQAAHQASAARSNLTRAMRDTEAQARDAFLGVESDISRVQALKQAYQSSQTALKATQAGYEVGTRTAVDVLDARRQELQARVNYARARYDYILNTLRLKQAAGMLDINDVEEASRFME